MDLAECEICQTEIKQNSNENKDLEDGSFKHTEFIIDGLNKILIVNST